MFTVPKFILINFSNILKLVHLKAAVQNVNLREPAKRFKVKASNLKISKEGQIREAHTSGAIDSKVFSAWLLVLTRPQSHP